MNAQAVFDAPVASLDLDHDPELELQLVRRALKTEFQGTANYRVGEYIEGVGLAKNLGHGDVALRVGRLLPIQEPIAIELDCLTYHGMPVTLRGRVLECRKTLDGDGFAALVHIRRGGKRAVN